ncbi:MAG: hypothetical protein STSR0004_08250 [Peptococcaceae bacterium]
MSITESSPEISELEAIAILRRFIVEQATFDNEKNAWVAKANKEIAATSLVNSP